MADQPDDQNDWIRYSGLDSRERLLVRRKGTGSRIFFSVFLITAGVLLFLGNLGVLPVRDIWQFWPLLLIIGGASKLINKCSPSSRVWGAFVLLFGLLFLLLNLGVLHLRMRDGSWPFSLLLIAIGFAALVRVFERSGNSPGAGANFWSRPRALQENRVDDFVAMGSLKRKVESHTFEGGDTTCILGNIELDLRHAFIPEGSKSAVLDVTAIFGATKIRVPPSWRVHVNGAGILGNFEDKTIPPNTGPDAPTLVITGYSIFGSVEIED